MVAIVRTLTPGDTDDTSSDVTSLQLLATVGKLHVCHNNAVVTGSVPFVYRPATVRVLHAISAHYTRTEHQSNTIEHTCPYHAPTEPSVHLKHKSPVLPGRSDMNSCLTIEQTFT